jgi:hypothetical protein
LLHGELPFNESFTQLILWELVTRTVDVDPANGTIGCKHPRNCIDTAKILIDSIHQKWNPTADNNGYANLSPTPAETEVNSHPLQTGEVKNFDPNFTLNNIDRGFRIFAFGDCLNKVPARRLLHTGHKPSLLTVFLHPHIRHAGEFNTEIHLTVITVTHDYQEDCKVLLMRFDKPSIPRSFSSAL